MSTRKVLQGYDREESVPRSEYFGDSYFELTQLFSLSHQIHGIHKMRPKSILEIGIGNGMVSDFFKKAGVPVTTADINPSLNPDLLAPLQELPQLMGARRVDVVVCCEVLEHMPLEELPRNIATLRSLGRRLFLTLPNYRKTFGLGGVLRLPKVPPKPWSLTFDLPGRKALADAHFWEVGSAPTCSNSAIVQELRKHYSAVSAGRFALNRYHRVYVAED
ncbi:methyltransferase domain-containing protein [Altererythrobacter soli]|uniref:Methyltransferase domain-containing protein n=1 Tax=Croceibacterium soli TaxID=1739690 RepID=A0A6I4UMQ8_9SPHN|nr:methyltransferase domain-containing protein [Croceibacterium soli]MXP40270.1 methyltransferase domain-containing protein [Croceibacterium soli]